MAKIDPLPLAVAGMSDDIHCVQPRGPPRDSVFGAKPTKRKKSAPRAFSIYEHNVPTELQGDPTGKEVCDSTAVASPTQAIQKRNRQLARAGRSKLETYSEAIMQTVSEHPERLSIALRSLDEKLTQAELSHSNADAESKQPASENWTTNLTAMLHDRPPPMGYATLKRVGPPPSNRPPKPPPRVQRSEQRATKNTSLRYEQHHEEYTEVAYNDENYSEQYDETHETEYDEIEEEHYSEYDAEDELPRADAGGSMEEVAEEFDEGVSSYSEPDKTCEEVVRIQSMGSDYPQGNEVSCIDENEKCQLGNGSSVFETSHSNFATAVLQESVPQENENAHATIAPVVERTSPRMLNPSRTPPSCPPPAVSRGASRKPPHCNLPVPPVRSVRGKLPSVLMFPPCCSLVVRLVFM